MSPYIRAKLIIEHYPRGHSEKIPIKNAARVTPVRSDYAQTVTAMSKKLPNCSVYIGAGEGKCAEVDWIWMCEGVI